MSKKTLKEWRSFFIVQKLTPAEEITESLPEKVARSACIDIHEIIDLAESQISTLQEKLRPLKEFARHAIKLECWNYEIDGGDLQEKAEKLGLIEPHIIAEGEEDTYGNGDYEAGDKIYVFSELLKEIDLPTGGESE